MSEYADPDLETVAPLPPAAGPGLPPGGPPLLPPNAGPPSPARGPVAAVIAAMVVVSLVVGFGVATVVLNARDDNSDQFATAPTTPTTPAILIPGSTIPGAGGPGTSTPGSTSPATTPGTTAPGTTAPADPDASALGEVILRQSDVSGPYAVALLDHGADLTVATLDLCNGTFASEAQRTARRQVALLDTNADDAPLSTEAVLYRAPAGGVQAFRELKSVAAHCPATPVVSPAGEDTATTTFRAAPDGSWPRTASVERLAYDFDTVDATTGGSSHAIAVYLRRGRALMGVYFNSPDGAQVAVAGQTTVAGIVRVFEARLANLPVTVVNG